MKMNILLLVLPSLLAFGQVQAQTLSQMMAWQATASKDSQSSVTLMHPGQQTISSTSPVEQVLAARLTFPDSGLKFQARTLSTASDLVTVILNSKTLTGKYQSVPATEQYYISYQQTALPIGKIIESGYELVAYW